MSDNSAVMGSDGKLQLQNSFCERRDFHLGDQFTVNIHPSDPNSIVLTKIQRKPPIVRPIDAR